jgi:hypothetical protein
MRRNGRDAPIPDLPAFAPERGGSTLSGRSLPLAAMPAHAPFRTFPSSSTDRPMLRKNRASIAAWRYMCRG